MQRSLGRDVGGALPQRQHSSAGDSHLVHTDGNASKDVSLTQLSRPGIALNSTRSQ